MKKILFIHLFNDRSGSPKVLSQTIKVLKEEGYETELIRSKHKNGFLNAIADKEHILFYKRSENKFVTFFYYGVSQILLFFQCLKYWNKDVVFYVNTMMPFGAALAGKLMSKKVIYHVHETSLRPKILKTFLRSIISLTANKIIFVSKYLQEVESFQNKKQIVIYNALEMQKNAKKDKKSDEFNLLMICSLKKYKGVNEFIQLAKFFINEKNIKLTLVLNATKEEINKYFKDIKVTHNITVYERQIDLSQFYKDADILLNLSRIDEWIETFGLTIVEGMEYGLPAIGPSVGGPLEVVRDNLDGFCISSYDIDKIAEKIRFLMNNKNEYLKFSENAKNRVKDFDIKIFEQEIVKALEDL
jgi:glycosyltransferase involved in cell wall biosynthesis